MLGRVQQARGELDASEQLLRRAFELQTQLPDAKDHDTIHARNGLAELLVVRGKTEEAEALLRLNVEEIRRVYGDPSTTLGIAWNNLANALSDVPAKYDDAERAYLEAIRLLEATLEPGHPEIANSYNNIGALYVVTEEWEKAAAAHRTGLELRVKALGPDHPNTAASRMGLAISLNRLGRAAEAEAMAREARDAFSRALGASHWRTANAQLQLGIIVRDRGRSAEALALVRPAHATLLAELGPEHPRTIRAASALAEMEAADRTALRTAR
jgi:tetratricopeptide (TPR) repeat protein